MKKISTQLNPNSNQLNLSPRSTTITFIKQFSRVYRPAVLIGMPGIILN